MLIKGVKDQCLIVDLEATCWRREERKQEEMETIEIGAVLVDMRSREILKEYDGFVRPVRNPVLSDFCMNLTSIRQSDVDSAEPFPVAFKAFLDWAGDLNHITFSSWSKYDRWQLQQDCRYHKTEYPFGDEHFDIKRFFAVAHSGKRCGLSSAMTKAGLEFDGTRHRGIDDARNIWRVLKKTLEENDQLSLF